MSTWAPFHICTLTQHCFFSIPHYRIIDDNLWNCVKARQKVIAKKYANTIEAIQDYHKNRNLNLAHRPRTLFSGKVYCAKCHGPCTLRAKNTFSCTNAMTKGLCDNRKSIKRKDLEERVLKGLKKQLITPSVVANLFAVFEDERKQINKQQSSERVLLEKDYQNCQKEINNLVSFIKQGHSLNRIYDELAQLESKSNELKERLANVQEPLPILPNNFAVLYKNYIDALSNQLKNNTNSIFATELIRKLVQQIIFDPDHAPQTLEIKGELANIISIFNGYKEGKLGVDHSPYTINNFGRLSVTV